MTFAMQVGISLESVLLLQNRTCLPTWDAPHGQDQQEEEEEEEEEEHSGPLAEHVILRLGL